ncbi:MAG TPA: DUF4412 domain-containing protein [Bacteroidia bacterium]|nr:DUF4412 domain-containing protein [Bacteroidia bacterium]
MKKHLWLLFVCLSMTAALTAQDFEGIVEFKKQEGKSQENWVWYVKGDQVRVDEFQPGSRVLKGCYLMNTKDKTAKYLDHTAKTWSNHVAAPSTAPAGCTVAETKNSKEFQSYKTTEYTLKTPVDTMHFSYWISTGKFGFFKPAVQLLGPTNMYFKYYWALEPKDNTMPMLVTRKNAKDEETGRFEVTRIEKRELDANLFNVPADYKLK